MTLATGAAAAPLIVICAAEGGVGALRAVAAGLPPDLPAALLVRLRAGRGGQAWLREQLSSAGPLPVDVARRGLEVQPGRVVVVPAEARLALAYDGDAGTAGVADDGDPREPARPGERARLRLVAAPRAARPLDALLRSAAHVAGAGAIGVVLSGSRDHAAAGLQAIQARGGLVVVQDPRDADVPAMPCAALRAADVEWVVPAAAMGPLLARLARARADAPAGVGDRVRPAGARAMRPR